MTPRISRGAWAVLLLLTMAWPSRAAAGERIHGENSSFAGQGVVVVWGVLRGASDLETRVILRLVPAGATYSAVSVEGVDPFTEGRTVLLPRSALDGGLNLWIPRASFAEAPQREIHLYTGAGGDRPALTIYFLGLPDTTPEFDSEAALSRYVDETVTKLLKEVRP